SGYGFETRDLHRDFVIAGIEIGHGVVALVVRSGCTRYLLIGVRDRDGGIGDHRARNIGDPAGDFGRGLGEADDRRSPQQKSKGKGFVHRCAPQLTRVYHKDFAAAADAIQSRSMQPTRRTALTTLAGAALAPLAARSAQKATAFALIGDRYHNSD